MTNDNASPDVIEETPAEYQNYARLYFRPRTPTQYRNEGIRDGASLYRGAHCPVPVFFCFDLVEVLSRPDAYFSTGSMGRPEVQYGNTQALFESIPFELVYHSEAIGPELSKSEVIFRRHAEILIPKALPLDSLVAIACRSKAESQTLVNLAGESATPWVGKIHSVGDPLFFRNFVYLETVQSEIHDLVIRPHSDRWLSNPPPIKVLVTEFSSNQRWKWEGRLDRPELRIKFPVSRSRTEVFVHGVLAYQDDLDFSDDIPF